MALLLFTWSHVRWQRYPVYHYVREYSMRLMLTSESESLLYYGPDW